MAYLFDSNINLDQIFQYDPIPKIDLTGCELLDADWLSQLSELCGLPQDKLNVHAKSGKELTENLAIIYRRLVGQLNRQLGNISIDEKNSIIEKLQEGVHQCTPGFHNRVNSILLPFQLPKDLSQLLFKVRMSLVEKAARSLTDEVHAYNHCFVVANSAGLGVQALFANDRNHGDFDDDRIRQALEKTFQSDYRALNLPFLLQEELRSILSYYGYTGKKEEGYQSNIYENIKQYIDALKLSDAITYEDLFVIKNSEEEKKEEDEKESAPVILDVNWRYLSQLFYGALQKHDKIASNITPKNLWECETLSLLSKEENQLTGFEECVMQTLSVIVLCCQLSSIKQQNLRYYNLLITNCSNTILAVMVNGMYHGKSPLVWAVRELGVNAIAIEVLLDLKDIDVNAMDDDGNTALMWVAQHYHYSYGVWQLLLNHKDIDVNVKNRNGETLLIWSAINKHIEMMQIFLNHKDIDVNAKDHDGNTALIWSAFLGVTKNIQMLLSKGADINARNQHSETALILAARKGHTEIVSILANENSLIAAYFNQRLFAWNPIPKNVQALIRQEVTTWCNQNKENADHPYMPLIRYFENPQPQKDFSGYLIANMLIQSLNKRDFDVLPIIDVLMKYANKLPLDIYKMFLSVLNAYQYARERELKFSANTGTLFGGYNGKQKMDALIQLENATCITRNLCANPKT